MIVSSTRGIVKENDISDNHSVTNKTGNSNNITQFTLIRQQISIQ